MFRAKSGPNRSSRPLNMPLVLGVSIRIKWKTSRAPKKHQKHIKIIYLGPYAHCHRGVTMKLICGGGCCPCATIRPWNDFGIILKNVWNHLEGHFKANNNLNVRMVWVDAYLYRHFKAVNTLNILMVWCARTCKHLWPGGTLSHVVWWFWDTFLNTSFAWHL